MVEYSYTGMEISLYKDTILFCSQRRYQLLFKRVVFLATMNKRFWCKTFAVYTYRIIIFSFSRTRNLVINYCEWGTRLIRLVRIFGKKKIFDRVCDSHQTLDSAAPHPLHWARCTINRSHSTPCKKAEFEHLQICSGYCLDFFCL